MSEPSQNAWTATNNAFAFASSASAFLSIIGMTFVVSSSHVFPCFLSIANQKSFVTPSDEAEGYIPNVGARNPEDERRRSAARRPPPLGRAIAAMPEPVICTAASKHPGLPATGVRLAARALASGLANPIRLVCAIVMLPDRSVARHLARVIGIFGSFLMVNHCVARQAGAGKLATTPHPPSTRWVAPGAGSD